TGDKTLGNLRIHWFLSRKFIDRFECLLTKHFIGVRTSSKAHHREASRQGMLQRQVIERGEQLAVRQVTGCTENDHDARLWSLLHTQSFTKRIGSLDNVAWRHLNSPACSYDCDSVVLTSCPPNSLRSAAIT